VSGRVKVTRLPWDGPWHSTPCQASGLSTALQPERSCSSKPAIPGRATISRTSSSRVRTRSVNTSPTASARRAMPAASTPNAFCQLAFSQGRNVASGANQAGASSAGSRCNVPRIAQVLTSRRAARAASTAPGSGTAAAGRRPAAPRTRPVPARRTAGGRRRPLPRRRPGRGAGGAAGTPGPEPP
jgi:hypothetical protein